MQNVISTKKVKNTKCYIHKRSKKYKMLYPHKNMFAHVTYKLKGWEWW